MERTYQLKISDFLRREVFHARACEHVDCLRVERVLGEFFLATLLLVAQTGDRLTFLQVAERISWVLNWFKGLL